MRKRIECKIRGIVQGVNFRSFVRNEAVSLNVVGFARNDSDGAVFVVAEGEEIKLQKFLEKIKNGPTFAKVSDFEFSWKEASGEFSDFVIDY
ncbi:MAG: acylphosphatase [bacterium]|nr:acylphosphatase [bacterium]